MGSAPTYITKNRLGIYCFQYAIPSIIHRTSEKQNKRIFGKSLRTKDRRLALNQARLLWLTMEKLVKKYFGDNIQFAKAMKIFARI